MSSETIYRPATHAELDPRVEPGLEATIGAPLKHWVITTEDIYGRVLTITPDDQWPNVSHDLAEHTVARLT